MNTDELGQLLSDDILNAPEEKRMVAFLLFGIRYAKHLKRGKIQDVLRYAAKRNDAINFSYNRQLEHGVELAKYVRLE